MKFKRIYIEITNICNMNCSFCSKIKRPPHEMSSAEFSHVLKDVKNYTEHIYLHVKGEPLSHSEIDKILTICDSENINVNITTNGTLLNTKKDILKKHRSIRQLNISLHRAEKPSYASEYVDSILSASDELKKYFMISLRIWTFDNKNEANNIILNKLSEKYTLDLSRRRMTLDDNIFLSLADTFDWPSYSLPDYGEDGFCLGARRQLAILSNGDVVPCCLDADGEIVFGNIFKSALSQILETKRYKTMYNSLSERKLTENLCRHCSYRLRF